MANISSEKQTPKLGFLEKFGFGALSTSTNIVFNFKSTYYLFFLTDILGVSMGVASLITTFGIVWDAINDPLVGYYAVNHRYKNGERIRPFTLWYCVPWVITTVLMFTNFHVSDTLTIIITSTVYFFFELFYTCLSIPYNSMAGVATNRDDDRRDINVARNLGGLIGGAIGAVALIPLVGMFGGLDERGNVSVVTGSAALFKVAILLGVICIIGCLFHYFTTKERVNVDADVAAKEEKVSLWQSFKALYSYKQFVFNTLYILLYGLVCLLMMNCIVYYAKYILGSTAAATGIEAVYLVACLVGSLIVGLMDKQLGRKTTMLIAAALFVVGKIWFVFDPYSMPAIYVNALTTGFGVAVTFVMFNTNRNSLSDLIEWREGRRYDGMIGTADNLASKLGEAGANLMITQVLAHLGFDNLLQNVTFDAQPANAIGAIHGINAMLGWVPMIVGALMIVIILFMDIQGDYAKMKADI